MGNKKYYIITSIIAFVCFAFATYLVIKGDTKSYYAVYSAGAGAFGASLYLYKKK